MAKMNPVVHFEMATKDKKRTADFYSKAFGWNMQIMGEEYGGYLMAQTAPTDEQGMNKTPGTINGGFFNYKDEEGFRYPHLVISIEDLDESIKAVKENGGEILGDKMEIPGIGMYASFKDTEGNIVGMLQPPPME
jgi:uncharacterized protein